MKRFARLFIEFLVAVWLCGSIPLFGQSSYVYTNDNVYAANTVSGFAVGSGGALTLIPGSPFSTGGQGDGGGFYATPRIVASPVGGFLYVADGVSRDVAVFSINPASGSLTPVAGSPFTTGTTGSEGEEQDLALAVTPDNKFLFAGDSDNDEIAVFSIGAGGVLTAVGSPYVIPGALALFDYIDGMAVSPDGNFLAVTLPSISSVQGEMALYSIAADGSLTLVSGSPSPTAGGAAGAEFSCSASTIFMSDPLLTGMQVEVDSVAPSGALSPVSGSPFYFTTQGTNSNWGILSPTGLTFYESNQYSGQISGFSVASTGGLTALGNSPFATGLGTCTDGASCPMGMAINQAGTIIFLGTYSPAVAVLSIANDGTLTPIAGSPFTTGQRNSRVMSLASWPTTNCPPMVNLSQPSLTFANQLVATTSGVESVTLTNASPNSALTITSIVPSGNFALATTGTSCPYAGGSVPSRATCTIDVTYTPSATGASAGTVTITDNGQSNPQTLTLAGTGVAPAAQMLTTSLPFADQNVNTTSAAQILTLTNVGTAPLTISAVAIGGDFAETNTCGASVGTGGNCTISVTFTPTAPGTRSGTLTITDNSNGVNGTTQTVSLSGTGLAPWMSLSVSTMTFSAMMVGQSTAAQVIALTNTGNASLTISGFAMSGDFSQTNNCGLSLAVGAKCTINVTFTPAAGGARPGNIKLTGNAPNCPQVITLNGIGQDFVFAPPPSEMPAQSVSQGSSTSWTFVMNSQGGFNQSVSFACTGAPAETVCSVTPSTASMGTTVTVTAMTASPSQLVPWSLPPAPPLPGPLVLVVLPLLLVGVAWAVHDARQPGVRRLRAGITLLAAGLLLTLAMSGCGASAPVIPHTPGTPVGQYTLTITGTSSSGTTTLTHSTTVILVVS